MNHKKCVGIIKRMLAGILVVGMVLTGMPTANVEAANEVPGQTEPAPENPEETPKEENPGDEEVKSGEKAPGEEETTPGDKNTDVEKNPGGEDSSAGENPGDDNPGEEEEKPEEIPPGGEENDPEEENPGDGESKSEEESKPEEENPEDEEDIPEEEVADKEEGKNTGAVFGTSVSENDLDSVSENALEVYEPEVTGIRVVGGNIDLPGDWDVPVVDERARVSDYEEEVALLMSDSVPAKYEPETGSLPLTRSQSPYGSCWAHSAMALAEIDMMKHSGVSRDDADYSELHLAYFSYNGAVNDPLGGLEGDANFRTDGSFMGGGNISLARNVLTNWVGAADEDTAPYPHTKLSDEELKALVPKNSAFSDVAHLQNVFRVNLKKNADDAKRMIMEYGGIGVSYYADEDKHPDYYNAKNNCYYQNDVKEKTNHAVIAVGWDDKFSKDNFTIKPDGDGAWLIRNSWDAGKDTDSRSIYTYFWLSYYDASLSEAGYAFDFEDADNYHHNYQYDGGMQTSSYPLYPYNSDSKVRIANVFTAKAYEGGERLEAVGIAFEEAQVPYKISIYTNLLDGNNPESGTLVANAETTGTSAWTGFYTISLNNPVNLVPGESFSVVVELEPSLGSGANSVGVAYEYPINASWYKCEVTAQPGQSFYNSGSGWADFGEDKKGNLRIKAYTVDDAGESGLPASIKLPEELQSDNGIEVGLGDTYRASYTVLPRSAKDRSVTWESSDPSIVTVDENGLLTGMKAGEAEITVTSVAAPSVKASFHVTVFATLRSIKITGSSSVTAGETLSLQTVRTPSGISADEVQWESADERVLTVDADGVVTGIAPGYATVTVGIGEVTATKEITCEYPSFVWSYSVSGEGLQLSWDGYEWATDYQVYRAEEGETQFSCLASIPSEEGKEAYSYLDRSVEGGKKYRYEVRALVPYIRGNATETKTVSTGVYIMSTPMPFFYPITYHLNGGSNSAYNPNYYREETTRTLYRATRAGYDFTGWYTDVGLTQKCEKITSDMSGALDLYAGWEPITYSITYYRLDGATNHEENPSSFTIESESFMLKEPTKPGYRFLGWYTDSAYTKPISEIKKGVVYVTSGTTLYLYAEWEEVEKKITYELDGGVNAAENPSTYISTDGTVSLKNPTKVGYDFQGWYKENTYENRVYNLYSSLVKDDLTLYAKWGIHTYKITYNNGGTHSNPTSYTIEDLDFTLQDAVKSGYRFAGWYTDSACTKPISEIKTDVCANISVYAKWERIYTITYELNGGVNDPSNPATYVKADVITLGDPTKEGYTFAGWYTDGAFANQISEIKDRSGNLTLYAKWTETPKKITYVWNGGNAAADLNPSTYVTADGAVKLNAPTRDGYDFQGWYKENTYLNKIEYLDSSSVTGDLTLFAKWQIHTYTITYVTYDGEKGAGNPATYTVESAVIVLQDAVRADSEFEGWYSDPKYQNRVTQINPADMCDITLYAKWKNEEAPEITGIQIEKPVRTTYRVGESLDVSGGKVTCVSNIPMDPIPMNIGMISGFDSSIPGIVTVTVSYEGFTADYQVLIVEEPQINAFCGQRLDELKLPENNYGSYAWEDADRMFDKEGTYIAQVSFTPNDREAFQILNLYAQITVTTAPEEGALENGVLILQPESFTYTGTEQEPQVTVRVGSDVLVEDQDYIVSYHNNRNAGTATVVAEGIGSYYGSLSQSFKIEPAVIRIRAKDLTILVGSRIPNAEDYEYEINGLLMDDMLLKEPTFICDISNTQTAGQFLIVPSAADAGPNYTIDYEAGQLLVVSENLVYRVIFDVEGHGTAPTALYDIKAGSTIDEPAAPEAEGYVFKGWCKDAACTIDWDFETDIVQSDITLYARWLKKSAQAGSAFQMQEMEDIYYYTGNACKPAVRVYDGENLLKVGKDYTVKYFNNINANAGGVWKKGNGQGADFNQTLPYVQIIGKGNYTDEIKVNFDIHPAVIADEKGNPAQKVVMRFTDQFVTAKKGVLKPFGSVKYIKGMKQDRDYRLTLTAVNVKDGQENVVTDGTAFEKARIPAGYVGEFLLTVEGIGNYEGSILKTIQVTDKAHLMKNARITLGKNQRNVELDGECVELMPSTENSADTFTVKIGNTILTPDEDYTVSYLDDSNQKVGKATLVITGLGEYVGTKTANFTVRGKAFTANKITVTGIENKVYTGRAITQNDAVLVYNAGQSDERQLTYGRDYTVSYAKNINKGTAAITFKGLAEAGFSGSFKKSFKIKADNMNAVNRAKGWDTISVEYSKAGAKPAEQLVFTNAGGVRLKNGKDYKLSYRNNNLVANSRAEKAPTIIVKGKGNYEGSFEIPFTITKADLRSKWEKKEITIRTTAVAYQPKRADDYAYKPAVKVLEGKTALRARMDVEITYRNNTQADYNAYIQSLDAGNVAAPVPMAIITVNEESSYMLGTNAEGQTASSEIAVPLTIYRNKLTKKNIYVEFLSESIYTGAQVKPKVQVFYLDAEGKRIPLTEKEHYTLSYGANNKAGKNAGSVTISGIGSCYGGDVTVKFAIQRKKLLY